MGRRTAATIGCFALAIGLVLGLAPATAMAAPARGAQAVPATCDTGDYPPHAPAIEPGLMLSGGHLVPGSSGSLTLTGAAPGGTYGGTLFSPTISLPPTTASAGGTVSFANVVVPAGFTLAAAHHLDVSRDCALVGAFDFCVTAQGGIAAASTCAGAAAVAGKAAGNAAAGGTLPRTGWDHLVQLLRLAALAIALGVYLRYLQRRRALAAR